jgi:hypothetical protein
MLDRAKLVNIAMFLERVPVTGKEAFAFVETYSAVVAEIKAIDDVPPTGEVK